MIISFIISMGFLWFALQIMKQCCPFIINPIEQWGKKMLNGLVRIIWRRPERRGVGHVQPSRIRYRR